MAPSLAELLADLAAEQAVLDGLTAGIDAAAWATPTPSPGWDVRDQVGHLAWSEELAGTAIADPDGFRAMVDEALRDPSSIAGRGAGRRHDLDGPETLAWWRKARDRTRTALAPYDGRDRIMWIEGPMSALSFTTARIMETWAHGQDVVDALGLERPATPRLRHVADIGVRTRPFAYRARGRDVPATEVRVELEGPDGQAWAWGGAAATDRITGPALDFCLVATQRRNVADTRLAVTGAAAEEWLEIAQAFAGPPTTGPAPGAWRSQSR